MKKVAPLAVGAVMAALVAGCGGGAAAPGPDVRGMNLQDAEGALTSAHIGYSTHAKDALFGVLVASNFVVCTEKRVNGQMVRLEVAKHGC